MTKINYLIGSLKHLLNIRVSKFAILDNTSKIHATARIYRRVKIVKSSIGAYSYVANGTELLYSNIGKFCSIGRDCLIGLPNHSIKHISTSPIFTSCINATQYKWSKIKTFEEYQLTQVGCDVWIGSRVIVKGGIKIGDGVIIGTGAVVTKDIPDYAIVAGVPARIIKYRFDPLTIEKLKSIQWWNKPVEVLKKNIHLFQSSNIDIDNLKEK